MADYLNIRLALENGVKAFNAANLVGGSEVALVMENESYVPVVGTPYQEVFLLPADTAQPGMGADGISLESGILQVTLNYPRDEGPGVAARRADLLRTYFKRSTLLTHGGSTVQVERKPSIAPARVKDSWYVLVVSIPYFIYS